MCWVCKSSGEYVPSFAIWYYYQTRFSCQLCKKHLDHWLDNADNEPDLEPSNVVFL